MCFIQTLSCVFIVGPIKWGFLKESRTCQGSNRVSQKDLRVLTLFPTHKSDETSSLWLEHRSTGLASYLPFFSNDFLTCEAISDISVLTLSSSLLSYFCLHMGHCGSLALRQYPCMQSLQKLCPQGVETGRLNKSRQMGQRSCSSDSTLPIVAISGNTSREKSRWDFMEKVGFGFSLHYMIR